MEPELITIIEGPTPDFMPNPQGWVQSIYEGPMITDVALCQLRTGNGSDIVERCERAWEEGRVYYSKPVVQKIWSAGSASRGRYLSETDEGQLLLLWVTMPWEMVEDDEESEIGDDYDPDSDDIPF